MATWKDLPPELRHQIFEAILSTRPTESKAIYAAVCREWQTYFEQKAFQKLALNYSCISDFGQIVRGREDIVKHIWLRFQPPKRKCFTCGNLELPGQLSRNNRIFTNALWKLMELLGSWGEVDRNSRGQGLKLEISVHAPSNAKHHFDCCTFDKDIHPCKSPEVCTGKENCSLSRQLLPFELRGNICDVVRNRMNFIEELRTIANIKLDFSDMDDGQAIQLPTVRCVKELTIRSLNVRRFERQTVKDIARSFGKLETFDLESELL